MVIYPKDLIPVLMRKWAYLRKSPYWKPPTLPPRAVLELLLDVAFHATFIAEEGRRPGFRVIYYPSKVYNKEKDEPDYRFRMLAFDLPRPYTVSEVNRLAPAAELTRILLCVENISNDSQTPDLRIWSMLDVGENWWKFIHNEVSMGYSLPNHLTITSSCPGELSLSVEGDVIMTLRNGQILYPASDALQNGPVADFLKSGKRQLYKDVLAALKLTAWDDEGVDEDYPLRFYTAFLKRILFYIRQKQHGGLIIIIPNSINKNDTRLTDRINIKYPCSYDYSWDIMVRNLAGQHRFYDLHFPLWDGKKTATKKVFQEYHLLSDENEELDEALGDAAQAIAALTSVDGAVVMTDLFQVMGFGAEVIAISSSLREIVMAIKPKHYRLPIESYGTRHRAAFRFCSTFEDSVALVVSRDGGVKAIKRVGSDVFFWPDIDTGSL
jgi:hypothetical protein